MVRVVNVVVQGREGSDPSGRALRQRWANGRSFINDLASLGNSLGVRVEGELQSGGEPDTVILDFARRCSADLIIIGTSVHVGSARLYLGSRVERILRDATCTVIVVNIP